MSLQTISSASAARSSASSCRTRGSASRHEGRVLSLGPPDQRVSSLSEMLSSSTPPYTMPPSDPLPTGSASVKYCAGLLYHSMLSPMLVHHSFPIVILRLVSANSIAYNDKKSSLFCGPIGIKSDPFIIFGCLTYTILPLLSILSGCLTGCPLYAILNTGSISWAARAHPLLFVSRNGIQMSARGASIL